METRPSRPIGATCGSLNECVTDQQTDRPTDQPTDTASYRGALSHIKRRKGGKSGEEVKEREKIVALSC